MSEIKDFEIYIDDDGYTCFTSSNGNVWWTLHYRGWEAYLPKEDVPCFSTMEHSLPTEKEIRIVAKLYNTKLKNEGK